VQSIAYVKPFGGLGNQIKPLISALWLTNKVFTTSKTYGIIFKNEIPFRTTVTEDHRVFSDWRFELKDRDLIRADFGTVYLDCVGEDEQVRQLKSIDFEYYHIPRRLMEEVSSVFRSLEFTDVVNTRVSELTKDWNNNVIAVHVRSWSDHPLRRRKLFDLDAFFKRIDRRRSSLKVFLATDSSPVLAAFQERYGDRLLHNELSKHSESHVAFNKSDEAIIRAFVDMICLSKAEILIGTYLSTFTECAWWFGACRQHIEIV